MTIDLIEQPWIAVVAMMAILIIIEELAPRDGNAGTSGRIVTNVLLYALGAALVMVIGFASPIGSRDVETALVPGFGVAQWLSLPWAAGLAVLFLVESLLSYWLHRVSHEFMPLWRIHAVHHTDNVVDVTTGIRHHPLEVLPAFAGGLFAIVLCGATPAQSVVVALVNTIWALATHAAVGRAPVQFPRSLRYLVSPAFHRLHHSSDAAQTNSNYGNMVAIWDWLFGTARDPAREEAQPVGLGPRHDQNQQLACQLSLPFRRAAP